MSLNETKVKMPETMSKTLLERALIMKKILLLSVTTHSAQSYIIVVSLAITYFAFTFAAMVVKKRELLYYPTKVTVFLELSGYKSEIKVTVNVSDWWDLSNVLVSVCI